MKVRTNMFIFTLLVIFLVVSLFFRVVKNNPAVDFDFNGKKYKISSRKYDLIQRAQQGDIRAQYEIITEYYEVHSSQQFIPELCFFYTEQLAKEEKDLGVITELGDLYFEGVGTARDTQKAADIYYRALELYDNPTPELYIPQRNEEYRKFLEDTANKYKNAR